MGDWWEFQGQRDKVVTLTLLVTMCLTATFDLLFDWINLSHLESAGLKHGLLVGPPVHSALVAMLMFNIIATMTYIIEIINTFTILTNKRHLRLPVVYEQGIIMLLVELPQAAINLSIVTCRLHYVTNSQVAAGVFSIINSAMRLYVYSYFREREYSVKEVSTYKTTVKIALYVTVSVLWLAIIVTYTFSFQRPWMTFTGVGTPDSVAPWLSAISILYLNEPYNEKSRNYSINEHVTRQGLNPKQPWLLKNLDFIVSHTEAVARYPCQQDSVLPPSCETYDNVKFLFKYYEPTNEQPFGSVYYNFALESRGSCEPQKPHGNWSLVFAVVRAHMHRGNLTVMAYDPWWQTCTQPSPGFDDSLDVC